MSVVATKSKQVGMDSMAASFRWNNMLLLPPGGCWPEEGGSWACGTTAGVTKERAIHCDCKINVRFIY